MRRSSLLLIAGICLMPLQACTREVQAKPPVVMGYYPDYHSLPNNAKAKFKVFTHIMRSFVEVTKDGEMKAAPELTDPAIIAAAHAKGVKVILAMAGASASKNFGYMIRNPEENTQFIKNVVKLMVDSNCDGLAVDWEQPEAGDKQLMTEFVTNLRAAMKTARPDSTLMVAVNSSPDNSEGYDGAMLRDQIDYLQVMTYDFHGPWSRAGHHASLFASSAVPGDSNEFNFPAALRYWRDVQGFRPNQITFGIAGYGRGFKVRNWGEKEENKSEYGEISFSDIQALIGHGWTRGWDAEAHAPWLLKDDKSERISYDDEQSVKDKAVWMKQNGLAGFFIWEMTQEYVDGDFVLSAATKRAWGKAKS